MEDEQTRVRALRDRLEHGVLPRIGDCFVLGDPENRLPNTSNIAFEHLEGEAIIHHLNRAGIAASLGLGLRLRVRWSHRTCCAP